MLHLQPLTLPQPYLTDSIGYKYIFENTDHYLLEVKRADAGDLYERLYWLKISKDNHHVSVLNLKSIDSSRDIEERFFDEGYFKFNVDKGIFIEKFNSGTHHYQLIKGVEGENMFMPTLQKYFSKDRQLTN